MEEVADKKNIFAQFVVWWLYDTPKNLLLAWRNFLNFNLNYFSIPLLLKTLFSPWKKYEAQKSKGFNIGEWLEKSVANIIFRLIGAFIRIWFILFGLIFQISILAIGTVLFLSWIFLPFLTLGLFILGIKLII